MLGYSSVLSVATHYFPNSTLIITSVSARSVFSRVRSLVTIPFWGEKWRKKILTYEPQTFKKNKTTAGEFIPLITKKKGNEERWIWLTMHSAKWYLCTRAAHVEQVRKKPLMFGNHPRQITWIVTLLTECYHPNQYPTQAVAMEARCPSGQGLFAQNFCSIISLATGLPGHLLQVTSSCLSFPLAKCWL